MPGQPVIQTVLLLVQAVVFLIELGKLHGGPSLNLKVRNQTLAIVV
jgi:hypothetical protein